MRYTVDLHKNLVQMPLPIRVCPQFLNPFSPDPCGEYRAEPVPAETHGFVADVDPALVQKVFDIPKRKREPDIQHHRKADFRAGFEYLNGERFVMARRQGTTPPTSIVFLLTTPDERLPAPVAGCQGHLSQTAGEIAPRQQVGHITTIHNDQNQLKSILAKPGPSLHGTASHRLTRTTPATGNTPISQPTCADE